jgi:uncharacterized membrane protein YidH (DUF202 family)
MLSILLGGLNLAQAGFTPGQFKNINDNLDTTLTSSGVTKTEALPLLAKIITALIVFVGMVFFILIIYGGVMWMTAMGNEDKVKKSRALIIASVIGLALIILAYLIASLITSWLTATP